MRKLIQVSVFSTRKHSHHDLNLKLWYIDLHTNVWQNLWFILIKLSGDTIVSVNGTTVPLVDCDNFLKEARVSWIHSIGCHRFCVRLHNQFNVLQEFPHCRSFISLNTINCFFYEASFHEFIILTRREMEKKWGKVQRQS